MDRKIWAFALVSVAVVLRVLEGEIVAARVALGGVANVPLRVPAAEALLLGAARSEATFARAAEAALEGAHPLSHNAYKLALLKGLLKQALRAAAA
jgi:xanthine dehydrogenase YagS FAD-binding subunit